MSSDVRLIIQVGLRRPVECSQVQGRLEDLLCLPTSIGEQHTTTWSAYLGLTAQGPRAKITVEAAKQPPDSAAVVLGAWKWMAQDINKGNWGGNTVVHSKPTGERYLRKDEGWEAGEKGYWENPALPEASRSLNPTREYSIRSLFAEIQNQKEF